MLNKLKLLLNIYKFYIKEGYIPCLNHKAIWKREEDRSGSWIMNFEIIQSDVIILGFAFNNKNNCTVAICNYKKEVMEIPLLQLIIE